MAKLFPADIPYPSYCILDLILLSYWSGSSSIFSLFLKFDHYLHFQFIYQIDLFILYFNPHPLNW